MPLDALSNPSSLPGTVPAPNYDLIKKGDLAGRVELVTALQSLIEAFNQYVARKGA